MFCGLDDIYCVFMGSLDNLSSLMRQYGMTGRSTNEALLVIEAYRTLRDRGVAADGSVVICDDRAVVKAGCGKSYTPFPAGLMFHSEGGLKSFEAIRRHRSRSYRRRRSRSPRRRRSRPAAA